MHKKNKIIITLGFLFFTMIFSCFSFSSRAKTKDYTVRIYGGKWGKVNGKEIYEKKYPAGTYFRFQDLKTQSNNEKYYIKGIRESGKDNNTVGLSGFLVQEDADYVLAFGIKGELVEYQVRYVDENGKELAKSESYYGNAGDKPVIACKYINGYLPNARNITGTLKNDKSNVFEFVYTKVNPKTKINIVDQNETVREEENVRAQPQTTSVTQNQNTREETPANNTNPSGQPSSATQEENPEPSGNDTGRTEENIPELYDIDDDQTPKSQYTTEEGKGNQKPVEIQTGNHFSKMIPYILLLVFVLLLILFFFFRRRKKEE